MEKCIGKERKIKRKTREREKKKIIQTESIEERKMRREDKMKIRG